MTEHIPFGRKLVLVSISLHTKVLGVNRSTDIMGPRNLKMGHVFLTTPLLGVGGHP